MAYSFNGTNQSISTNSGTAPVTAEGITLAHYFVSNSVSGAKFMLNISSAGNLAMFSTRRDADGSVSAQKTSSSGATATSAASQYTSSTLYHLANTFTSTTSREVFLDGASKATNATNIGALNTSGQRVVIGRLGNSTNGGNGEGYHDGQLSECAIWSVVLTAAEITSLFKGFKPYRIRPQSLVFYAPLVRDLIDARGGLALTNNNTATVADHPRVY